MIILSLGKKGSGKTALIRKLVFRRLTEPTRPLILFHDPNRCIRDESGVVYRSMGAARASYGLSGTLPQLSIFRGVSVDALSEFALQVKHCTLVLDELDRACQGKTWKSQAVRHIVHEGRHEGVDLMGTFRSTRNVNEDLLGQADFVFVFRHSDMNYWDIKTLEMRLGPHYAEAAKKLEKMQFVAWSDD